jgi:hypothetical protein
MCPRLLATPERPLIADPGWRKRKLVKFSCNITTEIKKNKNKNYPDRNKYLSAFSVFIQGCG